MSSSTSTTWYAGITRPSVPSFRVLYKIHKAALQFRPITGNHCWCTQPLAALLAFLLQPYIKDMISTHVSDTDDFQRALLTLLVSSCPGRAAHVFSSSRCRGRRNRPHYVQRPPGNSPPAHHTNHCQSPIQTTASHPHSPLPASHTSTNQSIVSRCALTLPIDFAYQQYRYAT